MYPNQMDLIVRKEQCKDLLHEAEQERLIGASKGPSGAGAGLWQKVVNWFSTSRVGADPFPASPTPTPALK